MCSLTFPTRNGTSSQVSCFLLAFVAAFRPEKHVIVDQVSLLCAADVSAEGSSFRGSSPSRCSDLLAEPLCPEGEAWAPGTGDLPSRAPRQELELNQELLQSGAVTLPGEHGCLANNTPQASGFLTTQLHLPRP